MDKQSLSERDICTKYVTPSLERAGWDIQTQVREEVTLTLVYSTNGSGFFRTRPDRQRILLVMATATCTGKTSTAFQIILRL